jgi:DNA-binding CsgD family transcriptional regulator
VVRLSEADYRAALGFVHEAGEVVGPDAFPRPIRDSLVSLLRADTGWHGIVVDRGDGRVPHTVREGRVEVRWGFGAGAFANGLPPGVLEALREHPHEDPSPATQAAANRPLRRSDLVSTRSWRKTGRWAECDRPVGARDWVRLWVGAPEAPFALFEFDTGRSAWDDRVVAMLELLAPHLEQLMRRAQRNVAALASLRDLTPREVEILALVAEGRTNAEVARILWISPHTVRKHLENTFEKLSVHTRAAAVARAFGAGFPGEAQTDREATPARIGSSPAI